MTRFTTLLLAVAALTLGPSATGAQTVIGDLNNFDTLNDTGQTCHGFEIEIDDIHSTDITYTFDWNHYGTPKIREDNTLPAHPKVFVRYESTKDASGNWGANGSFTNTALPTLTPPTGHTCTDTSVNEGCEHFGVGYYGTPTTVVYHWLIDDHAGGLTYVGSPVGVAAPTWTYTPPAPGAPAQVVAAIPAPVVPLAGQTFGEPSWVKVIKTTAHSANPVALGDLISDDANGDGKAEWQNGELDEVESEWKLLQTSPNGNGPNDELQGGADDMGLDGLEIVTRRYEFYQYSGAADTLDGENGEAMCSEVNPATDPNDPLYRHGVGTSVAVTDANGDTQFVNCEAQVVVGNYTGAQMAGFAAAAPLGLVDHVQGGDKDVPYTPRTMVIGGTAPYEIIVSGNLPHGLSIGDYVDPQTSLTAHGVLFGTPSEGGDFPFYIDARDAAGGRVITDPAHPYALHITGAPISQVDLVVQLSGTGTGSVAGNGIDCGATCSTPLDVGTSVSLAATPDAGSRFGNWSGACTGTAGCNFTLSVTSTVTAEFTKQWALSVSKSGGGNGTVSGNGIDCGGTCSVLLDQGAAVSLAAAAAGGSVFIGWSGDCTGTGSCSPDMSAARSVDAMFVPSTQQYALTVTVSGSGAITSSPKGVRCGKQCATSFSVGTTVTLTAKPANKHVFLGWTGDCVTEGTSLTCTLPMLRAQTVGAVFN